MRALVLLALLAPTAAALDAWPDAAAWGPHDARVPLRLVDGGPLRVEADPAVGVALVDPAGHVGAFARTPLTLPVAPAEVGWHGLPGAFELALRRDDARQPVEVRLVGPDGAGALLEWPASRPTPAPALLSALGAVAVAVVAGRRCISRRPT